MSFPISPDRAPFVYRGIKLPEALRLKLDEYADEGHAPGDFLLAVLFNDLQDAIGRADSQNLAALPAIVGYVYNELPSKAWGSPAKVTAWIDRGGSGGPLGRAA